LFKSSIRRANYNPAQYSRRQSVWAHLLYLRDLEVLKNHLEPNIKICQLFALAFAFEHFDYSLEILDQVALINPISPGFLAGIKSDVNALIDKRTKTALGTMTHAKVSSHANKEKRERLSENNPNNQTFLALRQSMLKLDRHENMPPIYSFAA